MNTPRIRGAGGGGGKGGGSKSARTPVESPDSLRSRQLAKVIDMVSEGEIVGLVDGLKSVYLNDTPIEAADGTINFTGVMLVSRTGTQAQTYIPGFPSVEAETQVATEVIVGGPVVRSISNANANAMRVTISFPRLSYQNLTNGDLSGTTVQLAIDVNNNGGGYVQQIADTITGKTTSRYQRAYRIDLPSPGPWDVRVRRITADSTTSNLTNAFWWDSYTEVIDAKLRYPNSALCALAMDSEQFNAIPRRGYEIKGMKVLIPDNYDPLTRVYSGAWSGTFTVAWTDNPAWCFYDLITNTRYGLGNFISAAQVDKWALYTIGQYCDELVYDGLGAMEPRFTCNLYLQTRDEAYRVIDGFASIFRGMAYWAGGAITAVQDSPQDVAAIFAPANVIGGQFSYEGSSAKARHTTALVSWNDPDDRYRQKVEYVEDADGIERYGVIQSEILAVGCTSRGQAHRLGRWMLYSERMESEMVSFRTGLEGIVIAPGDVIQTTDPVRAGLRMGGRLVSATTSAVVLDAAVTISAGKTYTLWAALPDGTVEARAVTTAPASTAALAVSPAFSAAPQAAALWVLAASDLAPETWRVVAITEIDATQAEITAVAHDASKFAAIEQDLILEPLPTSNINTGAPAVPAGLTLTDEIYSTGNSVATRIIASWQPVPGATLYLVSYRRAEDNWIKMETTSSSVDIFNVADLATYTVQVKSVSALGNFSAGYAEASHQVIGKTAPPADVPWLTLNDTSLAWGSVTDPDLAGYQLRWLPGAGADWGQAAPLHSGLLTASPWTMEVLPYGSVNILIKAVDTSGNESVNATSIVGMLPDPLIANVIETLDIAAAGYPGLIAGATVSGGSLLADSAATIWNPNAQAQMWQADGDDMWNLTYYAALTYIATVTVTAPLAGAQMTIDHTLAGEAIDLDYRTPAGDSAAMWGHAETLMWGPDAAVPMRAHAPGYAPWPGALTATAGDWQIRIKTNFSRTRGRIDDLSVVWDVPDREVYLDDVVIAAPGGTQLSVGTGWNAIRVVNLTLQNDGGTARTPIVIDKSLAGPLVKCLDATGVATTGKVDAIIQGY
jgi:hypothetical protein